MNDPDKRRRGRPRQSLPSVEQPNDFALWMRDKGLEVEAVASLLDVSESVVYGWRKGSRTPSLSLANRIARVSNGAVKTDSWEE